MTHARTPTRTHMRRRRRSRLQVDPIACAGHGLCADLLPERVRLDDWGYPVLEHGRASGPLDDDELPHARAAVSACPTLALRLEHPPDPS
jgi:ferredoxin